MRISENIAICVGVFS